MSGNKVVSFFIFKKPTCKLVAEVVYHTMHSTVKMGSAITCERL